MKNRSLTESLGELNEVVKQYINARIRLMQVVLLDKFAKGGTLLISAVIIVMAIAFIVFLLTLAFSYWYGQNYGSIIEGFLLSAAFYLIITLIIYWLRKPLITNRIIKESAEIFFEDR